MFVLSYNGMKRLWLLLLLLLILAPVVNAQFYDLNSQMGNFFGFGYYYDTGFLLLKLGVLLLLFIFLFKGTKRMFPDNNAAAVAVAGIIAVMAMAFMPAEWVTGLGDASGVMGMVIITALLVALPFIVMSSLNLGDFLGRARYIGYSLLLLLEVFALQFFIKGYAYTSVMFSSLFFYFDQYFQFILGGALGLLVITVALYIFGNKTPAAAPP